MEKLLIRTGFRHVDAIELLGKIAKIQADSALLQVNKFDSPLEVSDGFRLLAIRSGIEHNGRDSLGDSQTRSQATTADESPPITC